MYKTITFPIEIEDKSNYLQLMEKCSKMINEYVDKGLKEFYLRPNQIIRMLKNILKEFCNKLDGNKQ